MQFLANENFPLPSIKLLRKHHHVISISEESPGINDERVIRLALDQNLIILTFDRDYGEIIFRHQILPAPAVIYFRFKGKNPEAAGHILNLLIESGSFQLENHFTVIEESGIRQRDYLSD